MSELEGQRQYISLANKYRPQTFEDMVGQESISKTLQSALKTGRIAHAYLFYGPRGCGKTTTARILAKALNCTGHGENKPTEKPCGKCPQCLEISQSADMDVMEIDAASNTGVDNVRQAIIDTVALASARDRFKIFILDEVHMLSTGSFNALLKTIEEPPAHVVFILATTEKNKVPATIVSRCQTFRFRPIAAEVISEHLLDLAGAENIDLTPEAAKIIAKNAGGAMRDALTLLDRVIAYAGEHINEKVVAEMLGLTPQDLVAKAIEALIKKDNNSLHEVFETLGVEGFDALAFLKDFKNALGELFYFSLKQGDEPFSGAKKIIEGVSPNFLAQLARKTNKLMDELRSTDNALVNTEIGLFTVMNSSLDIAALVARLEALENGTSVATGSTTYSAPTPKPVTRTVKVEPVKRETFKPVVKETPFPSTLSTKTVSAAFTPKKQEFVAAPAPVESEPFVGTPTEDKDIWKRLLQVFSKSIFTHEFMISCSVKFNGDEWLISFPESQSWYEQAAAPKLPEIEAEAKKISGRNIKIKIVPNGQPASVAKPTSAASTAPTKTANNFSAKPVIYDEKPLVKETFSADILPSDNNENVPEELKDVLDIIPGEVISE